ncbi:MAG TPA: hypothetical protein VGP72_33245 [Planctomycetota bacterium]|jgi:hypothetical protein
MRRVVVCFFVIAALLAQTGCGGKKKREVHETQKFSEDYHDKK